MSKFLLTLKLKDFIDEIMDTRYELTAEILRVLVAKGTYMIEKPEGGWIVFTLDDLSTTEIKELISLLLNRM